MFEVKDLKALALLATAGGMIEPVTALKENESDMKEDTTLPSARDAAEPYRVCNKCGETHPIENFPLYHHQPGRRRQCKPCHRLWRNAYRKKARDSGDTRDNERNKIVFRELRLEIVAAYGGLCVCCGESAPELLNIDHIYNDGAEERKTKNMFSSTLHYYLRKHGYPKDRYQLLCVSCNMGKAKQGVCPHVWETPNIVELARMRLAA